jgi:hypothetical protein
VLLVGFLFANRSTCHNYNELISVFYLRPEPRVHLIGFIGTQAPKAKYILSVCGGAMSMYLAFANKAFYRLSWCILFIQGIKFDLTHHFILGHHTKGHSMGRESALGHRWVGNI